jgi:multiple antibiotic resistance protein
MAFTTLTLTLFLIMNPLGNMKHFLLLLEGLPSRRRTFIIWREMLLALAVMYSFAFLGDTIAKLFHYDQTTCFLSSAVILFLVGIKILFPSKDDQLPKFHGEEPFIVPIAIPIIASPALLATIMVFAQAEPLLLPMSLGILIAWGASVILLLGSQTVVRFIGQGGLTAIERLMGMILILISVQRFMEGILLFIGQQK